MGHLVLPLYSIIDKLSSTLSKTVPTEARIKYTLLLITCLENPWEIKRFIN